MMDRIDAYAAIAEEIDNIMTETYGDKYDKSVLKAFSLSWANEKEADAQVKAYGIEVGRDGYDISKEDIRGIALQEIERTMDGKDITPGEVALSREMSKMDRKISIAQIEYDNYAEQIKEGAPDKEEMESAFNNVIAALDELREFYSDNKDVISDDKYNQAMDDINDIEEKVQNMMEKQLNNEEILPHEEEEISQGVHKLFEQAAPSFTTRADDEDREIDD